VEAVDAEGAVDAAAVIAAVAVGETAVGGAVGGAVGVALLDEQPLEATAITAIAPMSRNAAERCTIMSSHIPDGSRAASVL
jgi:hypothetical protein